MRRKRIVSLLMALWMGSLFLSGSRAAMAAEAGLAISDKELIERLARIETRLEEGFKNLQLQIDGLQRQIDENQKNLQRQIDENQKNLQGQIHDLKVGFSEVKSFILWGFGIMIMGMFALVSFVIWDRRTALAPTMNQVDDLRRRERDLEDVLRKYAVQEPRLAEIMRDLGLLAGRGGQ